MNNRPQRNQFSNENAYQNAMRKYKGKGPATNNRLSAVNNLALGKILSGLDANSLARMRTMSKAYRNYINRHPNLMSIALIRKHNQIQKRLFNINTNINNYREKFVPHPNKTIYNRRRQVEKELRNIQTVLGRHFLGVPNSTWYAYHFANVPARHFIGKGTPIANFARQHGL